MDLAGKLGFESGRRHVVIICHCAFLGLLCISFSGFGGSWFVLELNGSDGVRISFS